jgi:hypothetical protein
MAAVMYLPSQSHCSIAIGLNGRPLAINLGLSINKLGSAMSDQELKSELERLRNENAALKKGASTGIRMKVSEKGAVSIYGMGRFPVTLYKEQWLKLLALNRNWAFSVPRCE